jgi:formate hydrogenlyase transcriptional activator
MTRPARGIDYNWNSHATERPASVERFSREEIWTRPSEREIIGDSAKLRDVMRQVAIVGPTNSTVLILGETGTGKGRFASMLHNQSSRRDHPFVKVNCAAIPLGLLESELFGHERGAFTGAIAQRIGRFELANRGTLFLDEIGDIPAELQPKLLRVLQEREFERLGSTQTIRTDVRLIAATHRNLTQMISEGKFRVDLFYRLNVFPLTIPPLRDRREDIPLLVKYFVEMFSHAMNKRIEAIPAEVMESLARYSWPGNIRELENFIERAVILSQGAVLEAPLQELAALQEDAAAEPVTLKDAERAHILRILRAADGVIATAAARLGVPRSTLFYKMRRLGISAPRAHKPARQGQVRCAHT